MVRRSHNSSQNESRVSDSKQEIEDFPERVLARLTLLQCATKDSGMIDDSHANAERIAKVHGRHSGKHVHKLATHPNALRIVVVNSVEKAIFGWEEPGRHARVDNEGDERAKVGKRKRAACNCECFEGGRDVVVPAKKAV